MTVFCVTLHVPGGATKLLKQLHSNYWKGRNTRCKSYKSHKHIILENLSVDFKGTTSDEAVLLPVDTISVLVILSGLPDARWRVFYEMDKYFWPSPFLLKIHNAE